MMNKQIKENSLSIVLAAGVEMEFMRVPAGKFLMGSDKNKDLGAYDDELPQHEVYLDEYWMGKYPITVAQYAAYTNVSNYRTRAEQVGSGWVYNRSKWDDVKGADWRHPRGPGSDVEQKLDNPVTQISWNDARAFCDWVSKVSKQRICLPSEAEWEKAARGTDGRIFPWGNQEADASYSNFNMNIDTAAFRPSSSLLLLSLRR